MSFSSHSVQESHVFEINGFPQKFKNKAYYGHSTTQAEAFNIPRCLFQSMQLPLLLNTVLTKHWRNSSTCHHVSIMDTHKESYQVFQSKSILHYYPSPTATQFSKPSRIVTHCTSIRGKVCFTKNVAFSKLRKVSDSV